MAKFNAGTAVEAMEWDFTDFGGGKGIVPEPSTGQVETFFDEIRSLATEVRRIMGGKTPDEAGDLTEAEAAEVVSAMDDGLVQQFQDRMIQAVASLCSDNPSEEQIRKLPYRVLSAFNAWIAEQVRPEAQRPATSR